MPDIVHKVSVKAPAEQVYQAVATVDGLKSWWTEHIDGESAEGGKLTFRFPETGPTMEVLELMDNELVKWKCVEGPEEWLNTIITFEFEETDGVTELLFAQSGWEDATNFFAHCNTKWATFMLSLKHVCEGQAGAAFPNDMKIEA